MGKVNVVLMDGSVVSVDEETARAAEGEVVHRESLNEDQARKRAAQDEKRSSALGAFALGALDTISFGGAGKAFNLLNKEPAAPDEWGPEYKKTPVQRAIGSHTAAYGLGEVAGFLTPFGAPELAASAGAKVAGKVGSKLVGRAVEGAVLGVGAHVAHTNVTGDPLSIEGAVQDAGIGAILNVGIGALSDGVLRAAGKSKAKLAEIEATEVDRKLVDAKKKLWEDSPLYEEAKAAHNSALKKRQTVADNIARNNGKYVDFVSSHAKVEKAINEAESVINTVEKRPGYRKTVERPVNVSARGEYDVDAILSGQLEHDADAIIEDVAAAPATGIKVSAYEKVPVSEEVVLEGEKVVEGPLALEGSMEANTPTAAKLKEWRGRISDMHKKLGGGWRTNGSGRWIKDASVEADAAGALEDLRVLRKEMTASYPKAAGKLKTELPDGLVEYEGPTASKLPNSLKDFARQRTETIAKLANDLDPVAVQKFETLAEDLGFAKGATPQQTIVDMHKGLQETMAAFERLKLAKDTADKAASQGLLGLMRKGVRNMAGAMAGFKAYTLMGGGVLGAGAAALTRTGARVGMEAAEEAVLGQVLVSQKEGVRAKLRELVANHGEKVGKSIGKLAPVTSYLTTSFVDGVQDSEKDIQRAAVNRIQEIHTATMTAPDALYLAVQDMMGHPADVAWKVHNKVLTGLRYLSSMTPKDPGINRKLFQSDWTPSYDEAVALGYTIEAAKSPLTAIYRAMSGDIHPAAIETLWNMWPASMQELGGEMVMSMPEDTSYEKASTYSAIFRTPMSPLQEPEVITYLQGMFLPQPDQGAGTSSSSPNQPGRPAAVQSRVAGSSVSGLISQ
jgi:hypothetical protein